MCQSAGHLFKRVGWTWAYQSNDRLCILRRNSPLKTRRCNCRICWLLISNHWSRFPSGWGSIGIREWTGQHIMWQSNGKKKRWTREWWVPTNKRILELSHAEIPAIKVASLHQHKLNITWQALAALLQNKSAGLVFWFVSHSQNHPLMSYCPTPKLLASNPPHTNTQFTKQHS